MRVRMNVLFVYCFSVTSHVSSLSRRSSLVAVGAPNKNRAHINTYRYIRMHTYIHTYIDTYIYIYIYVYMYTHLYTYILLDGFPSFPSHTTRVYACCWTDSHPSRHRQHACTRVVERIPILPVTTRVYAFCDGHRPIYLHIYIHI